MSNKVYMLQMSDNEDPKLLSKIITTNFSTDSYSRGPMSLNMSLETFKHLIRFFLIIGIASSVEYVLCGLLFRLYFLSSLSSD